MLFGESAKRFFDDTRFAQVLFVLSFSSINLLFVNLMLSR